MQQRNFLLFITACLIFFLGWLELQKRLWPPVETPPTSETPEEAKLPPPPLAGWDAFADRVVPPPAEQKGWNALADRVVPPPAEQKGWNAFADLVLPPGQATAGASHPERITPADHLITLGDTLSDSPFHLRVLIDPRGAGVRSVILNKFKAADALGRPTDKLLELIPEQDNTAHSSYLLYHFDPNDSASERPLDTLGSVVWHQVGEVRPETNAEGQLVGQTVAFEYVLEKEDVKITKIFSLKTGDYHVGLEVRLERRPGSTNRSPLRYQLAGPHGLPIEGKWYTSIFRNAMILREDKDKNVFRNLEDSRQIGVWGGGTVVPREPDKFIRYAGIALQFFASVLVVSDNQEEGIGQDFLARARPTIEVGVTKGPLL
jgi:YidC/Oxa1 family membrane protein insertase